MDPTHLTSIGDPTVTRSTITDTGALSVASGVRTGRSPKDKRIVLDEITKDVRFDNRSQFGGET
jgi:ATP-dependent phosphoenolpyruvate carboxykinase